MFCLIRPPGVETFRVGTLTLTPPLGAAYIAAAVERSGRAVHVIDAVAEAPRRHTAYFRGFLVGLRAEEIVARIPAAARQVGISCIFTHEWPFVVHLVDRIKRARPELPVVVGGEHVTSMPELSLATSQADQLVLGEGEETIVALLDALETGAPLEGVDGIAWRDADGIVVNRRRARNADIDAVAPPAWRHFDLETYHANRFVGGLYSTRITVPMLATRGCPYQCTYCSAPNMWTPRWIARDPVKVVDEIEGYVREHGAGNFPFQDLTAIVKKDWIVAFCNEILRRGLDITWQMPSGTRSEAIDDEVADLLRRTGMICTAYAPESGSDETRRLIKKRMERGTLLESVRASARAGLNVAAYIVIGFPHDREEHMRETLAFVRDLADAGVADLGNGYYMALPGTELFESLFRRGRIRFDREYFRHILEGLAIFPAASYCDAYGRAGLFLWKLRLNAAFYGRRMRGIGARELAASALAAFGRDSHATKLQTALRVALTNAFAIARTRLRPRWISRSDERRLFAGWDAIHRAIAAGRAQGDAEPLDADRLHERNVIPVIRRRHASRRVFRAGPLAGPEAPAA